MSSPGGPGSGDSRVDRGGQDSFVVLTLLVRRLTVAPGRAEHGDGWSTRRRHEDDKMGDVTPSIGTLDPSVHLDRDDGRRVRRARRILYATTTSVLATVMGLAAIDALGVIDVYGVDTAHVRAVAGDLELDVRYGTVSRPGLATPFEITVTRTGGFDEPVVLAVDGEYLSLWDENGLDPEPSASTADGSVVMWEFDPPRAGDVLMITYDARIEPAAQHGKAGRVAVLDADGLEIVAVTFTTRVLP
jgi:hypothetical protein